METKHMANEEGGGDPGFTGLDEFMRGAMASRAAPESSEGDDGDGSDGEEADDRPDPSDEDVDAGDQRDDDGDEDHAPDPHANDSRSRLVRNIARIERAKTEALSRVRALEAENARLRQETEGLPDVEHLRGRVARAMGLPPTDARVSDRLFDLSQEITIGHLGDALDGDESLKAARARLQDEHRRRDERLAQERRIRELEERDRQITEREREREVVESISEMLRSAPRPFLEAAEDDASGLIARLAREAISTGKAAPRNVEEAALLVERIADNLDAHHRERAQRLSRVLTRGGKSARRDESHDGDIDDKDMTTSVRDGAVSNGRNGGAKRSPRSVPTNSGGGGRGRPSVDREDGADEMDLNSFMKRQVEVLRRGRRTGR